MVVFGIMVFGMMVWWYDVINFQVTPINPLRLGAHRISSIGWYIGKLEKISNFVKKVAEHQKSIQEKQFENEKDGKCNRRKRQIRNLLASCSTILMINSVGIYKVFKLNALKNFGFLCPVLLNRLSQQMNCCWTSKSQHLIFPTKSREEKEC